MGLSLAPKLRSRHLSVLVFFCPPFVVLVAVGPEEKWTEK
jgi:hypothetical protein